MENFGTCDKKRVILELTQGKIHANELKQQLNSSEACLSLLEKILCSYDNALAQLNGMPLLGNDLKTSKIDGLSATLESSNYKSEGTEIKSKDHHQVQVSKKRKTLPKWSERVRACSETGFEDGYSWRKYGQKDILGAIHPRAYYRCTYRHSQGCSAMKQVQRADDDPTMFEIVYRGKHSCWQEKIKQNTEDANILMKDLDSQKYSPQMITDHNIEQSLEPLTPIESGNLENKIFSENTDFRGASCLSPFLSPEASESYFDPTRCDLLIGDQVFLQGSDFAEIVSDPRQVSNFVFGDIDTLFLDGF